MRKTAVVKRSILGVGMILLVGMAIFGWKKYPFIAVGSAYKAKIVCSALFVSQRDLESILAEDVSAEDLSALESFALKVDREAKTVTTSFYGIAPRTAVYRKGIGATLAIGVSPGILAAETRPVDPPPPLDENLEWPEGSRVVLPDSPDVEDVVTSAFNEPSAEWLLRTRAVVVVHRGRIIAEQYAPGFSPDTPLAGWSMTKSVTNALMGILEHEKRRLRGDSDLLEAWRSPGDSRSKITIDDLLRMSSGLEFTETYTDGEDATTMLFRTGDASGFAAAKPLLHPPGTHYAYSSGTTNLLCRVIRETIGDDAAYHALPYEKLFHPIGAHSAVMERDASGTFVGSSFMYATARDWARIGLLFANDGVWIDGNRILPEGWLEYSRTPAPASGGDHGAHFWLRFQGSPIKDAFHMSGHEGQFVTIIPEKELVVVRLGLTLQPGAWKQEEFVGRILGALDAGKE